MSKHRHEKPFDPQCLHCLVNFTIEAWAEKNAPRDAGGKIRLEAVVAIKNLAEVMGELVYHAHDDATRLQFERFAHAEVERAFHAESVSNVIVVSFDRDAAA
jgi:hypothetical protein